MSGMYVTRYNKKVKYSYNYTRTEKNPVTNFLSPLSPHAVSPIPVTISPKCTTYILYTKYNRTRRRKKVNKYSYNCPQYSPASTWIRDLTEEGIEPHPGPQPDRILSKNIDGLNERYEDVFYAIAQQNARSPILAVLLQEHHLTKDAYEAKDIYKRAERLGLLYIQSHLPAHEYKGGTAIIIPHTSLQHKKDEARDHTIQKIIATVQTASDGRIVTVDIPYHDTTLRLASAYAPQQGDRTLYFNAIKNKLNSNTVLGIDANCVPDPAVDLQRNANSPFDNSGSHELRTITTNLDLTDIARDYLGPATRHFTNHTCVRIGPPKIITQTRIDQVYTPNIDGISFQFRPIGSDFLSFGRTFAHNMVHTEVRPLQQPRGKDLKTINESIYDNMEFLDTLKSIIDKELADRTLTNATWSATWEKIKERLRDVSLTKTMEMKEIQNDRVATLRSELKYVEADISAGNATAYDYATRERLRDNIRTEMTVRKALKDSLEEDAYQMGQRHDINSAAFHRKWTPKNSSQWIDELIKRDWTDPSNPQPLPGGNADDKENQAPKIAAAATEYYQPLFAKKPTSQICAEKCLATLDRGNRVLAPTAAKCSAEISEEELIYTCNHLPTGKSPGPDRLPNKLYKSMSKVVAPILYEVFKESLAAETLPETMLEGIITLLYKKKERDDPRNYRPITLLNNDYKILMRILAQRMNEAVVQFVSADQNGFVPDGFISENIMRLQLIQAMIDQDDTEAIFLFLDMEKAFDRCSWPFLKQGLQRLGFTQGFCKFIGMAYNEQRPPSRRMYVNGYLGPKFTLQSGVAQGCPISPLLFLIIMEPLARLINDNTNIEGVVTTANNVDTHHKISQFADDGTLIMRPRDVPYCLTDLKIWCRATAMRENATKREILLLGKLRRNPNRVPLVLLVPTQNKPNGTIKVTPDGQPIRALGVPIGNSIDVEKWWLSRYLQIKNITGNWVGQVSMDYSKKVEGYIPSAEHVLCYLISHL